VSKRQRRRESVADLVHFDIPKIHSSSSKKVEESNYSLIHSHRFPLLLEFSPALVQPPFLLRPIGNRLVLDAEQ